MDPKLGPLETGKGDTRPQGKASKRPQAPLLSRKVKISPKPTRAGIARQIQ